MVKEQFGTNTSIYNKLFYNSRGQLAEIRASTRYNDLTDRDAERGGIVNHYSNLCPGTCSGSSMTDNNGVQRYDYDSLNQLASAIEAMSGNDV